MSRITLIVEFRMRPGIGDAFEAAAERLREAVQSELSEVGRAAISAAATGHFTYRGGVDR